MQSQCPQCHTAFRVSEEQLELADGKVRCGQCMHVFIASEHFIDEPPAEDIASLATDKITMLDIETSNRLAEIELETSELELPDAVSIDDLNLAEIDLAEIEIAEIEMPSLEALDEHIEEEHTETDVDTSESGNEASIERPEETPAEEIITEDSTEPPLPDVQSHAVHAISEPMAAANETWLEHDASSDEESLTEQDVPPAETIEAIEDVEAEKEGQTESSTEEQLDECFETTDPDEAIPLLVDSLDASQLYPELDAAPAVERAQYTGLYSIAIIALLAVFSLQAIYALRDTLAEQPRLRPLMSNFCASFDCAITLPREPNKILLTRSEVRSHPAQSGALLVKASMQNQARFRQAYPILRLQFSDLDGRALVGRDFLPEEYLPDDVNIRAGMPINTDINLSLELTDPGGQAVSFDFNLL